MSERKRPIMLSWALRGLLLVFVLLGAAAYGKQLRQGLGVTGLERELPWGLYISQFTFLVGIGASAVTVLLPYYVHRQKVFGRALLLGEIVAVIALSQALLCILVDLGQPGRLLNIILYPSPTSLMFWDCLTLGGYLTLSVVGLAAVLFARGAEPARWVRGLALATIPWAIGIHVVTALLYAGLAARPAWMTAVLAPRFLATAFASGPALLILLATVLGRAKIFEIGREAIERLTVIMTYAALASLLLALLEAFTALYSGIPGAAEHLEYLFVGIDGHAGLVAFTYASLSLLAFALVVLLVPRLRRQAGLTLAATTAILLYVLVEKGLCLVTSGFVPSPLGYVRDYRPSLVELAIVAGVYCGGALVFVGACRWLLGGSGFAIHAPASASSASSNGAESSMTDEGGNLQWPASKASGSLDQPCVAGITFADPLLQPLAATAASRGPSPWALAAPPLASRLAVPPLTSADSHARSHAIPGPSSNREGGAWAECARATPTANANPRA